MNEEVKSTIKETPTQQLDLIQIKKLPEPPSINSNNFNVVDYSKNYLEHLTIIKKDLQEDQYGETSPTAKINYDEFIKQASNPNTLQSNWLTKKLNNPDGVFCGKICNSRQDLLKLTNDPALAEKFGIYFAKDKNGNVIKNNEGIGVIKRVEADKVIKDSNLIKEMLQKTPAMLFVWTGAFMDLYFDHRVPKEIIDTKSSALNATQSMSETLFGASFLFGVFSAIRSFASEVAQATSQIATALPFIGLAITAITLIVKVVEFAIEKEENKGKKEGLKSMHKNLSEISNFLVEESGKIENIKNETEQIQNNNNITADLGVENSKNPAIQNDQPSAEGIQKTTDTTSEENEIESGNKPRITAQNNAKEQNIKYSKRINEQALVQQKILAY